MVDEQKGLYWQEGCEYIADTENPYYDQEEVLQNAFRMLTEEMLCPPVCCIIALRKLTARCRTA